MQEPLAYLNGHWLPAAELAIPVNDAGFVLGTTVTEQLRTFGGRLFRLDAHLERLFHSLEIVEVDPGKSAAELAEIAKEAARRNYPLLPAGNELGLAMFVTPGLYPPLAEGRAGQPTVCVHTYRLPFALWAAKYRTGESVVVSDVEQISPDTWPPALKCRSRMHYYLADRRAANQEPGARAILLDREGLVSEATTANVVTYRRDEGLISPPSEKILPGISLTVLCELAQKLGISHNERDIRPEELPVADEILLTSTSVCVLPIVRVDGSSIGNGKPGPIFTRLLGAWSELVGLDIARQAADNAAAM